jgi:hypothetical protein
MKTTIITALLVSSIAISASADTAKQQSGKETNKFVTTQEYLAQPSQQPSMEKFEPAAGSVATNAKNPLLERKFQNFKR